MFSVQAIYVLNNRTFISEVNNGRTALDKESGFFHMYGESASHE
ncbi:hypothetical protein Q9306_10925 [Bacillus sp. WLY-B-L8]|nr:hypothetical protein [Bacillus sp. WLY-B-L8]